MKQKNLFRVPTVITPLWYVGSKSRFITYLQPYLDIMDRSEFVCPFIGGGAVELHLSSRGIRVHASDNYGYLVNFWNQIISDPQGLVDKVDNWWSSANDGTDLYTMIHKLKDPMEQAAVYWLINKTSYRGLTMAGSNPYRHRDADKKQITVQVSFNSFDIYRDFYSPGLTVELLDYEEALNRHPDKESYIDPPYFKRSKIYGDGTAPEFDHEKLRDILASRSTRWVLSYNDEDHIKDLYSDFHIYYVELSYQFRKSKKALVSELLISNFKPDTTRIRDHRIYKV